MLLDTPPELNHFMNYYETGGKLLSFRTQFDSNLLSASMNGIVSQSKFISKDCSDSFTADYSGRLYSDLDKAELKHKVDAGSEVISLISQSGDRNASTDSAVISSNSGFTTLSRIGLLDLSDEALREILVHAHISVSSGQRSPSEGHRPRLEVSRTFHLYTSIESNRNKVLEMLRCKSNDGLYEGKECMDISFNAANKHSSDIMSIATRTQGDSSPFDMETYRRSRGTSVATLGRTVIYADVVKTTTTILECIQNKVKDDIGLLVIASRQTHGKGRSGNKWLSPIGCAMCSLHANIPRQQDLVFLQHYVALAVVDSIRSRPGYQDLDIRIKWPNDIYTNRTYKLGGVLVKTSITGTQFNAYIGIGINVDNEVPSICVNDVIRRHNEEHNTNLAELSREQVIGGIISCLDHLIYSGITVDQFLQKYYSYWLHGSQKIHLDSEDGREATVLGLDEYGYLKVKLTKSDEIVTVFPDGNSFDMMSNLIVPKI